MVDGVVEFIETFGEFLKTPYIKLAHVNLSGMNLRERALGLAPALSKCKSLVTVHLEDNDFDEHTRAKLYEIFNIKSFFDTPNQSLIETLMISDKFRAVKKRLL